MPLNSPAAGGAAAVAVFLLLHFPAQDDLSGAVLGALSAAIGVAIVWVPATALRALPKRSPLQLARLVFLSLSLGAGLGVMNLLVNYGMGALAPEIHEQMITRWAKFSPWSVMVSGPIMEEIAFRLVGLSGLAWIVARFTSDRGRIFQVALAVSSLLFGVAHIFYGGVAHPVYMIGMAAKSGAAGLLLGWIFWRWGLPYSSVCHCAANAVHLVLMPMFFQDLTAAPL